MRHIVSLFSSSKSRSNARDAARLNVRQSGFEQLEERSLLSATPTGSILAEYSAAEATARAPFVVSATPIESPEIIELSSAVAGTDAAVDKYDIDYDVLESGKVRVLAQSGVVQYGSASYCAVPDEIYIELWDKAIARWEEAITVGVTDEVYPYSVDGATVEIDDLLLYFGFSDDYYRNATSLGSALNNGYYRDGGTGAAATGTILFNAKYFVADPSEQVQTVFYNTALHEIAHSLGYNVSHFDALGLVELSTETPYSLDELFAPNSQYYYYMGENGVKQYLESYPYDLLAEATSQDRFLLESYTTSGTFGAHPSALLGTYYLYLNQRDGMTFAISPNYEATITPMTLGVLEDLGYTVNYDVADRLGTPAPKNLATEAIGKTIVLNWEEADGDLSNAASGPARYQIERLAEGDKSWTVVATDVQGTTYYDSSVESGRKYSYRVRSSYVRSNEDVGVFRASAGDAISWNFDAEKYTIYALVNGGSNLISWSRIVASTSNTTWTVPSSYDETFFHVAAVGSTITNTDPSRIATVSVAENADDYVPDGYSAEDWNAIKRFLALVDDQGATNGYKVAGANYSPDLLQNVPGLTWKEVDGTFRLTKIENWSNSGLVGDLDLVGVSELSRVVVSDNALASIELDAAALTILNVSGNDLTSLDVSKLAALESLNCSDAAITALDVSNNTNLVFLDCGDNPIANLELAANGALATLKCDGALLETLRVDAAEALRSVNPWNASLTEVYLPSGFTGTVDLSDSVASGYEWIKSGEKVGEEPTLTFDGTDETVVATLTVDGARQTVYFYVGDSEPPFSDVSVCFALQSLSSAPGDSYDAALKSQRTWLDEWSNFYVDLWANAGGAPVVSVGASFTCGASCFELVEVEAAGEYSVEYSISAKTISVVAEGTGASDAFGWTLVARMRFAPVGGLGIPTPEDGVLAPVDAGFSADLTAQTINGAAVETVAAPSPNLYPFLFDVDESGVVNTNDLGYFLSYVGHNVDEIAYPKYRVLDYDHSGTINTNDLAYFLQYLGASVGDEFDAGYRAEPSVGDQIVLDAPNDPRETAKMGTTISLAWNAVSNASGYRLAWRKQTDSAESYVTLNASATSHMLSGLDDGATYCWKVQALGDGVYYADSPYTATRTVAALKLETPSTVVTTENDVYDRYDGMISLREALDYANSGETIAFADSLKGKTIALDPELGQLTANKTLTIDASDLSDATNATGLTISGRGASRILYVEEGVGNVEINGITLSNGYSNETGGAICNYWATLTLHNCDVRDNEARYGAAIYTCGGQTTLVDCVVTNNTASFRIDEWGGDGGVVYNDDATLSLVNCELKNNGNSVVECYCGEVSLTSCEIVDNGGDGVFVYDGEISLTDCEIVDNGGGVYAYDGEISLTNCEIVGNDGQGVNIQENGVLVANNCLIARNDANYGAGLELYGTATLYNCTITDNTSNYGGGVNLNGDAVLSAYNTIIAGNSASSDGDDVYRRDGGVANAFNTLSSFLSWTSGADNFAYDESKPLFTNAKTGDYTLANNSQAINKGNNQNVTTFVDLAGNLRVFGGTVDLGAYEHRSAASALFDENAELFDEMENSLSAAIAAIAPTGALVRNIPQDDLADCVDSMVCRPTVEATAQIRDESNVWRDLATDSKTYEITVYNRSSASVVASTSQLDDALLEEETLELLAENLFVEG